MPSQFNPTQDIPDLTGKVVLVSGGNAGLGGETVKHLALKGAKVYMASRSEERATQAIQRLEKEGVPSGRVEFFHLDLGTIKNAKKAGTAFLEKTDRLNILINSAGMLAGEYALNEEGILNVLATNHFGHFVFTTTILPLLKKTAALEGSDVRIVQVASESYKFPPSTTSFETFESLNGGVTTGDSVKSQMTRYGLSKLCSLLFVKELQARLDAENANITVIAANPGTVASDGSKAKLDALPWPISTIGWHTYRLMAISQEQGSYSSLFSATSPLVKQHPETYKAAYIMPYDKIGTLKGTLVNNKDVSKQLWELSEKKVAEVLA